MQWIEDSINKKFLKLYEFEEFKNVNKIYDGQCLEVYSAVYKSYRVAIKSLLYNNNECMNKIVREVGIVCLLYMKINLKYFFGINLDSTLSPVELLLYLQNLWSY
jgi:hypothetical protein